TAGRWLATRVGQQPLRNALVVDKVHLEAEIVILPFPAFLEVVDPDAHLLYAANHFVFHVAEIFLDSL
ncbi:MAG: hypothetical protein J6P73_03160, partial [Bacteroidales bacterium]|nr:hypothetical protein [Bacteroidales bacterium]